MGKKYTREKAETVLRNTGIEIGEDFESKTLKPNQFTSQMMAIRVAREISRHKLAGRLGYSRDAIRNWEHGKSPTLETMVHWAKGFGYEIEINIKMVGVEIAQEEKEEIVVAQNYKDLATPITIE